MFIASQLKKQNIVEYLLYMWQIEDLIRAYEFDMEKINENVIQPYQLSDENKQALYEWYESLIDMMRTENIQQSGHLQLNKNNISQLNEFHAEMLKSSAAPSYSGKFYHILPLLSRLRTQQIDAAISDIEICFNFLYGIMTLRMKKAEITPETQKAQEEISKFLTVLNQNYQLYSKGELTLE